VTFAKPFPTDSTVDDELAQLFISHPTVPIKDALKNPGAVVSEPAATGGSRSYLGRSASVSVSRACTKCGPAEVTQCGRAEVSRGRSSAMAILSSLEGPNISYQGVSRHDLDPSTTHRNQFARLNESRHQKASPCPVESQRDQSEPAAMMTKPLERSSALLMEKIVDTDNLVRAWNKVRSNRGAPGRK